jgi:hypothetical protein
MVEHDERTQYRTVIDALVDECRGGQGPVLPRWVRHGVWNSYALDHPDEMPEESRINRLLAQLSADDRDVVAGMLQLAYESAVHNTLVVLHEQEVPPFDDGYEGTPFHDFMGRLMTEWEWPT